MLLKRRLRYENEEFFCVGTYFQNASFGVQMLNISFVVQIPANVSREWRGASLRLHHCMRAHMHTHVTQITYLYKYV